MPKTRSAAGAPESPRASLTSAEVQEPRKGPLPVIDYEEVEKHNSVKDCWIIVKDKVYDVTQFATEHPGGPKYIWKYGGRDSTKEFLATHPEDIIKRTLGGQAALDAILKGTVKPGSVPPAALQPRVLPGDEAKKARASNPGAVLHLRAPWVKPDISTMLNLFDIEIVAQKQLMSTNRKKAWDYYSSGADDEITLRENHNAFHRIWLRPRILRNVSSLDTSCSILGYPSSCPIYLSAVAVQKLGHPDGEVAWTKAAASEGVIFMVPTLASCSIEEIAEAKTPEQTFFFQLYVNRDRKTCRECIEKAEKAGCKAMFITVDAPQLGRRERDMRNKAGHGASAQGSSKDKVDKSKGTSAALTSYIDPSLNWDDIPWFKSVTKMPIILKGVQCAEDALMAVKAGCSGVVVSNHGGRQLDFARSGIEVLPEVMEALRDNKVDLSKFSVFCDGGVRRGTDVFKALALGATAVGIGKPVAYGMSAYGQEGVEKVVQMLRSELQNAMRLSGCKTIADITPEMVITDHLHDHGQGPRDNLNVDTYIPLATAEGIMEAAQLKQRVAMQEQHIETLVAALASTNGPATLDVATALGGAVLVSAAQSFLTSKLPTLVSRTAVAMMLYLAVHMVGALQFFAGKGAFNGFHAAIGANPLFKYFEYYMLAALVGHVLLAVYLFVFKYKRLSSKVVSKGLGAVLSTGKLLFSGVGLLAFICLHLKLYRFAEMGKTGAGLFAARAVGTEGGVRDIYSLVQADFKQGKLLLAYLFGVGMIGSHLFYGWAKTVNKLGVDSSMNTPVTKMGQQLVILMCVGFAAVPLSVFASQ